MLRPNGGYLSATRHPWSCFTFLVPLLLLYEAGVLWLGGCQPETLRTGADAWMRSGLEAFGFREHYYAPALISVIFLGWSWLRFFDRPRHLLLVWLGMASESVLFAIGLWALSRQLSPLLGRLGLHVSIRIPTETLGRVITFVGAGIYEEVLFRLVLFFVLGWLLWLAGIPRFIACPMILVASAILFSAAHHIGPYGEPYDHYAFLFRIVAGFYFALVYQIRGFGIAVGAHAAYDVIVGVLVT